jgi:hypothetical protein
VVFSIPGASVVEKAHIEIARLVAFLLENGKLTEQEDEHLSHCSKCMEAMVTAANNELVGPDKKPKTL